MARYQIHIFCEHCSETHPMGVSIDMDDGPADKSSLGDAYKGVELPDDVHSFIGNLVKCPNTGEMARQEDHDQIFLVPVADHVAT